MLFLADSVGFESDLNVSGFQSLEPESRANLRQSKCWVSLRNRQSTSQFLSRGALFTPQAQLPVIRVSKSFASLKHVLWGSRAPSLLTQPECRGYKHLSIHIPTYIYICVCMYMHTLV